MAAHSADGFGLQFTSRTSWKAKLTNGTKLIAVIPVTWTKGYTKDFDSGGYFLEVWYRNSAELEFALASTEPFLVAMAFAKDYSKLPHVFDCFTGVFEVISTGVRTSDISIRTRVIRRVKAADIRA